jgi:hypothetical protein
LNSINKDKSKKDDNDEMSKNKTKQGVGYDNYM